MPVVDAADPILEIRGLAKAYGAIVALRSADVTLRAGEQHGIMGANGAGKSTLVKILTGVVRPDAGTITVAGRVRSIRSPAEAREAGLSPVHQESSLIPDLTLEQNFRLTGTPPTAVQRWLDDLGLRSVDIQALARDLPLATMRVIDLARALAADPQILILDEMTAALPADLTETVFRMLAQWRKAGRSLVFISHRLADVLGDLRSRDRAARRRHRGRRAAGSRAGRADRRSHARRRAPLLCSGDSFEARPSSTRRDSRVGGSSPAVWSHFAQRFVASAAR